jgi:hypothetical protein
LCAVSALTAAHQVVEHLQLCQACATELECQRTAAEVLQVQGSWLQSSEHVKCTAVHVVIHCR